MVVFMKHRPVYWSLVITEHIYSIVKFFLMFFIHIETLNMFGICVGSRQLLMPASIVRWTPGVETSGYGIRKHVIDTVIILSLKLFGSIALILQLWDCWLSSGVTIWLITQVAPIHSVKSGTKRYDAFFLRQYFTAQKLLLQLLCETAAGGHGIGLETRGHALTCARLDDGPWLRCYRRRA